MSDSYNREKVVVVETFGEPEIAAVVGDVDLPDPPDDDLAQFGAIAAMNGEGYAHAYAAERLYMFRERQLTAAQLAALSGLPVDE